MNFNKVPFILLILIISMIVFVSCNGDDDDDNTTIDETELITQYISDNNLTVDTDSSGYGLKYILNSPGTGEIPVLTDLVNVSYTGSFLKTGEVFDSSDSAFFTLNQLIRGWQILIPYLKEGGNMRMFIPSAFGYGSSGSGSIPPYSTLIFDVTLNKILTQTELEQYYIDQYVAENELVTYTDENTKLRYSILSEGNGIQPDSASTIVVDYVGYYLVNEAQFIQEKNVTLSMESVLEGWKVLLPKLKVGGKMVMFLPSEYAYSTGNEIVPNKTSVIFEVSLIDIK